MHDDVVIDKISSLPDEVLIHILSFLSTKEVVHTCILSRRWSNLWASVPVLKLDLGEFWTYKPGIDDDEKKRECEEKFERFVNGVIENRESSHLDTFEYSWSNDNSYYYETSLDWLNRVVALMPRVIRVYVRCQDQVDLPNSVFSCASLQNLTLSIHSSLFLGNGSIVEPEFINLPALEILELCDADLADNFTQGLHQGCPSLDRLILRGCRLGISHITSDVLKELDIFNCWQHDKMRISCTGLVSLSIQCHGPTGDISLENMSSLENAIIKLYGPGSSYSGHGPPILNVFSGISNATSIKLYFEDLQLKKKSHSNPEEEPSKEVLRNVLFQHEDLETVEIFCGNNVQLAQKMIMFLKRHVKTVGTIVVLQVRELPSSRCTVCYLVSK